MKHVFIINPVAGKTDRHLEFADNIKRIFSTREDGYEIYLTERPGHATEIVEQVCQNNPWGVRIYVMGGDGTLNEAVNGAYKYKNCALGIYPSGSGNDFIKSITGNRQTSVDLKDLIDGPTTKIDLIKCDDTIGANVCSLGFDAQVAQAVGKYKKHMNGAIAYDLAVVRCFVNHFGYSFKCRVDDGEIFEDNLLFVVAANGAYYGSTFNPAPAVLNDGLLDFVFVKKVSRLSFIKIIGEYKTGTYLRHTDIVRHVCGKKLWVKGPEGLSTNIDGEIVPVNEVTFEILPTALNLIIPTKTFSNNLVNMTIEFAEQ